MILIVRKTKNIVNYGIWQALDRVIMEARRQGIRLLLSLSDDLPSFGGKRQYVKWAWEEGIGLSSSNDSFFFDPSIRSYFKDYLKVKIFFFSPDKWYLILYMFDVIFSYYKVTPLIG